MRHSKGLFYLLSFTSCSIQTGWAILLLPVQGIPSSCHGIENAVCCPLSGMYLFSDSSLQNPLASFKAQLKCFYGKPILISLVASILQFCKQFVSILHLLISLLLKVKCKLLEGKDT